MRKAAILAIAFLLAVAAACEIVLPFDRSLIPADGGASGADSPVAEGDDAATLEDSAPRPDTSMLEDSAPTPDASMPSGDAGDATVIRDGSAEAEGAAGDGSPDGTSSADASAGDANEAGEVD
jgi:hypothetical protein